MKLVKGRSLIMQAVRYLGELTRCKLTGYLRLASSTPARQSRFASVQPRDSAGAAACFTLQILRRSFRKRRNRVAPQPLRSERDRNESRQPSVRFRGHAAGPARLGGMRKPDLGRQRREPHARHRRARHGDHGRVDRAHRRTARFWRLRPRALSASQAGRAGNSDRGASRYRASRRHAGKTGVAARRQQMFRPRHLRHEGRQLPHAGSDPAIGARRRSRRRCRSRCCSRRTRKSARPRRATSSRRRPRATNMCWCPNRAGPTMASSPGAMRSRGSIWKPTGKPSHAGATLSSGRSAIREMARQIIAIDGMTSEDCTFSVGIVHGGQWVNCVATTCTRRSAEHGQAPGRSRPRRRADAGAVGHRQRRDLQGDARRDPAGVGARCGNPGAV